MDELAPTCPRCRKRHLLALPCWSGRYAIRMTARVLRVKGRRCHLGLRGCSSVATTAEHDIPRSKGGTDALDNLLPACAACNSRRGNRDRADVTLPDLPVLPDGELSSRWR